MLSVRYAISLCAVTLSCTLAAHADVVNFDAQASGASSFFNGTVNSPLTIGNATFTGGQLIKAESGASPDQTGVYATASLAGGYTDPLHITFSSPVSGFSILVTNLVADTFTVADNVGDSSSDAIGADSQQTFSLAGSGITSVTISSANQANWDFAIDNVTFTPGTVAATPEPSSLALLGTGLAALARFGRRRRVA